MRLTIILVEPQVPENIGAAARAMKTMGFDDLRLVNSDKDQQPEASWLAHGSNDVLHSAQHYPDLASAVADCQLVIGTTAKLRTGFRELVTPKRLAEQLQRQVDMAERVAIVFGREDRGLSNEELAYCQQISSIPLVNAYPSLNLSQAVMLYTYELSSLLVEQRHSKPAKNALQQQQHLQNRVEQLFAQLNLADISPLADWSKEKLAQADVDSVRFLHSVCAAVEAGLMGQNENSENR